MSGEFYRWAVGAVLAVGLVAGGIFLARYRPGRWLKTATSRDTAGWVLVLWLLYAWQTLRVLLAWIGGPHPPAQPFTTAVVALALGAGIDAVFVYRLRRYNREVRAERTHPTEVCGCCGGRGLVPRAKEPT